MKIKTTSLYSQQASKIVIVEYAVVHSGEQFEVVQSTYDHKTKQFTEHNVGLFPSLELARQCVDSQVELLNEGQCNVNPGSSALWKLWDYTQDQLDRMQR